MSLLTALGLQALPKSKDEPAKGRSSILDRLPDLADMNRQADDKNGPPTSKPSTPSVVATTPTGTNPTTPPPSPKTPTVPPITALQAGGAADKNLVAFRQARAAVKRLLDDLGKHQNAGRIGDEIAVVNTKLGEADTFSNTKDWANATKALGEAKTLVADARKVADEWGLYLKERADIEAMIFSFASPDFDPAAAIKPDFDAADVKAKGPPQNVAGARADLKKILDDVKPVFRKALDGVVAKVTAIEATSAQARAFAKAKIDEGKAQLAAAEKALAAGEYSQCLIRQAAAMRVLGPTARVCERREKYDAARAAADAAIAPLRAAVPLKARAQALDKLIADADKLAAADSLKIEQAIAALDMAKTQATTWAGLVATITEHQRERAGADLDLAALDKHPAAAKVASERDAARKLLVSAKTAAIAADAAADPTAPWNAVLTDVKRARADVAASKALADSLGAASAAEGAAKKPGNKAALKQALDKLIADGKAAAGAAHAEQAKDQFETFDTETAAATAALSSGDGAKAATAVTAAAMALTRAKEIQAAHSQFAALLPELDAKLKALNGSTRAGLILPKIKPVADALAEAQAKDLTHDGLAAMTALRRGLDAVPAAQEADKAREDFDKTADELKKGIDAVADPTEKAKLTTMAANAKKQADALAFADAVKAQDAIEVALDKGALDGLMKGPSPDAAGMVKMTDLAKKMAAKGGAKQVDDMINAIPNGGDIKLLNALAEGRYGVKFTNEAPFPAKAATLTSPAVPAGDPVATMKIVCKMFSEIPQDIVGSPSVAGVEYKDAVGSAGGSHSYDDAKVRMNGRPGIPQDFGTGQQVNDPATDTPVNALPADVEGDCLPKDAASIEYLGFAAAHEVGHAVDDQQGFMARHGSGVKFGGWTTFGSGVQPIADAIATDNRFKAFCKTAPQKKYILDKLQSKPGAPPAASAGAEATALAEFESWFKLATSGGVYEREADSQVLKIGDHIYHEAYSRVWVRYLATARKRALTGYQFRAPGEWFAELYAGFRSGKLKDTHPSMEWLKKL